MPCYMMLPFLLPASRFPRRREVRTSPLLLRHLHQHCDHCREVVDTKAEHWKDGLQGLFFDSEDLQQERPTLNVLRNLTSFRDAFKM